MKKFLIFILLFVLSSKPVAAFRFGVWADTKAGTSTLNTLTRQMYLKNPQFLFYPGDVCDSGPTTACLNTWVSNYNAAGDLLSISFPSRGNHDSAGTSVWTSFFNIAAAASKIGAANYNSLSTNLTYSFDFNNSHFVAVDMPGGDATTISSAQLTWLDSDLTAAEARGVTHSFLFWHGPIYPMGGHCCTVATSITAVINKHPSVSAAFHGHEHLLAYTHVDSTKIPGVTHPFEEFIFGSAGADLYGCQRGDWCQSAAGFATVDVNGNSFSVIVYDKGGAVIKTFTFNKTADGPTPTIKPTTVPQPSPTPKPTNIPTTIPSKNPTLVPSSVPSNSPSRVPTQVPTSFPTSIPTLIPTTTPIICPVVPTDLGTALFSVPISNQGEYLIWTRVMSIAVNADSFWLQIDSECPILVGNTDNLPLNSWLWLSTAHQLTAGNHVLKIIGRESGVRLDRLLLIPKSSTCIPTGNGDSCNPIAISVTPNPTSIPNNNSLSIYPTEDTSSTNAGRSKVTADDKIIEVGGSPNRTAYLKFDLSSLKDKKVSKATLRLRIVDASSARFQIKLVKDTVWSQKNIYYRHQPRLYDTLAQFNAPHSGEAVSIDLTSTIADKNGRVFSFGIQSSGKDSLKFYSKENDADKPVLIIETKNNKNENKHQDSDRRQDD